MVVERQILHVDVNNAFLSWSAIERIAAGDKLDIRSIPSAICGDENKITDEALLADKNIVVASKDLINCDSLVDMGTLEYGFANSKASYNIYRSGENIVSSSFETVENQSESGFVNICRLEIAYEYCREFIELEKTVK